MKKIIYFLLALMLYSCAPKTDYDVIIVGGGLAGMAAANELKSKKVLLIEKEDYLGGRVLTASYQDKYFYDLGAVFALYEENIEQLAITDELIPQVEDMSIYMNGAHYSGATPKACFEKIPNMDSEAIFKIKDWKNLIQTDSLAYDICNTLVKSVFPTSLNHYNDEMYFFVWERHNSAHFKEGNQVVAHKLKNDQVNYALNSKVLNVSDNNQMVSVSYLQDNQTQTVTAGKAIVATPSSIALNIIDSVNVNSESKAFLNGVAYAPYHSIAVGVEMSNLTPDLSYVIPINKGFGSVLKQDFPDSNFTIFQLYIADDDFTFFKDSLDIYAKTIDLIEEIWQIDTSKIKFYDTYLWQNAGVLINDHYTKNWSPAALQPSKNVYLAGDYTMFNSIPYGMAPAITSGMDAAAKINRKRFLEFFNL